MPLRAVCGLRLVARRALAKSQFKLTFCDLDMRFAASAGLVPVDSGPRKRRRAVGDRTGIDDSDTSSSASSVTVELSASPSHLCNFASQLLAMGVSPSLRSASVSHARDGDDTASVGVKGDQRPSSALPPPAVQLTAEGDNACGNDAAIHCTYCGYATNDMVRPCRLWLACCSWCVEGKVGGHEA